MCRFTHFNLYLVDIKMSKTFYTSNKTDDVPLLFCLYYLSTTKPTNQLNIKLRGQGAILQGIWYEQSLPLLYIKLTWTSLVSWTNTKEKREASRRTMEGGGGGGGDRQTEPLLEELSDSSYNSSEQRLVQRTGKSSQCLIS